MTQCTETTLNGNRCTNNTTSGGMCGVHSRKVIEVKTGTRRPSARRRMLASARAFMTVAQIAKSTGESVTTVRNSCFAMEVYGWMEAQSKATGRGGDRRSPHSDRVRYRATVDMLPPDVDLLGDMVEAYGYQAVLDALGARVRVAS